MTAYTDDDVTAAAAAIDACERGDYDGIPILDGRLAARAALDAVAPAIYAQGWRDACQRIREKAKEQQGEVGSNHGDAH